MNVYVGLILFMFIFFIIFNIILVKKNHKYLPLSICTVVTFLIACVLYWDYLAGNSAFLYSSSDGFTQFLSIYTDFVHTLKDGNGLTGWNFANGFGNVQSYLRFFYPTNLIPVLAGFFIHEKAMLVCTAWMQVLKIVLAELAMYLFARKLKFNPYACMYMGITYAFCASLIFRGHWWILSDEFYMALFILLAAECYFQDKKWQYIPLTIALLTSCFGLYYVYLYGLELFIYATVRYVYKYRTLKGYFEFILKCGGLYLMGVLMVAVLLVDSFRSMMGTARYVAITGYKESLHLVEIVDLDVLLSAIMSVFDVNTNGVFHLYTGVLNYLERPIFYCGIGTLFFIPQAIILARKREKTLIGTGIIAAVLYMMFPFITDIFNLFIKNEELGARSYRLSSIWIIIVMVMIGGYGLHCCLKHGQFHRKLWALTGVVLMGIFVSSAYLSVKRGITLDHNVCRWIVMFIFLWFISVFFMWYTKENKKLFYYGILFLMFANLVEMSHSARTTINVSEVYADHFYNEMAKDPLGYYSDVQEAIRYIKEQDSGLYRVSGVRPLMGTYCAPLYYGIYDSSYYANINSQTYEFLEELYPESFTNGLGSKYSIGVGEDLLLSTITGYKYRILENSEANNAPHGYRPLETFGKVSVYENENNLSLGIVYDAYMKRSDFEKYSDTEQKKLIYSCVVLEDNLTTAIPEINENETDQIINADMLTIYDQKTPILQQRDFVVEEWTEDHIVGNIKNETDQVLVFSIPNVQGWKVWVDDVECETKTANIGFMALELSEGQHKIELKYKPMLLNESIFISVVMWLLYVVTIVIMKKRKHTEVNKCGGRCYDTI